MTASISFVATAAKRVSQAFAVVSMTLLGLLVGAMLFGVVMRYAFNAPPIWVFDISYMLNGTAFLLATGYTLLHEEHVRVDFLSERLSERTQNGINAIFYICVFLPALTVVILEAGEQAWRALLTNKGAPLSAWAPVVWPYYAGLALGLSGLWLQVMADALVRGRECLNAGKHRA